jgi:hypothetical protein
MSRRDDEKGNVEERLPVGSAEAQRIDPCADIKDPIRKGLCRVCRIPVAGETPFCKDHEPPVP